MRLFIALPLPEEVKSEIAEWTKALARELPDPHRRLHWVKKDQYHLTLKFLGETPAPSVSLLSNALKNVPMSVSSFPLQLSKVGHFSGRVVWLGIEVGADHAVKLAKDIEKSCVSLGFAGENKPFSPHITLARAKTSPGALHLASLPSSIVQRKFGPYTMREFCLIQSTLTPQGAIYRTLERFSF